MKSSNPAAIPATHDAADNKFLYAANVVFPTSGTHTLTTKVTTPDGTATFPVTTEIRPPASPISTYWPYLAVAPFAIAIFALRERIKR